MLSDMDTVPADVRSRIMARIRYRDTGPERIVRSAAHGLGLRFRLCVRSLPGTPDLVFPKHRAVVFVHGCFWHQHSCPLGKTPKSRQDYWVPKFAAIRKRDAKNAGQLVAAGWRVLEVWECQTREQTSLEALLREFFGVDRRLTR